MKQPLHLSGYGITLMVEHGNLIIQDGIAGERRTITLYRDNQEYDHIIIPEYGGSISFEAISWLMVQGIAVTMINPLGNIITSFCPYDHVSGVMKRIQATASQEFKNDIARKILAAKLKGQRQNLQYIMTKYKNCNWNNPDRQERMIKAIAISKEEENKLASCLNPDEMRLAEARAAAAYFQSLEGIPLNYTSKMPYPTWTAIQNRTSPKSNSPRLAVDPFNACLNYLYAVLETEVKITCYAYHIDTDLGFIHSDHTQRESLVFDLMEVIRPSVDRLLFEWLMANKLKVKDFFQTKEGICKLMPNLTKELVPMVKKVKPEIKNAVSWLAKQLRKEVKNLDKPKRPQRLGKQLKLDLAV